ncbi:MAG TPA: YhdH/YhfP family quinone oxidoreductase [Steroidobacteraceae bacterium]|nr:YhdH/YhfP family quinone oxidoreductase [Steroidobacteraceae bacterium]
MSTFKALRVHRSANGFRARFDQVSLDDLTPGEVVIRIAYSCINYKDALAVTGKAPIVRGAVRTAGIDLSGVVESGGDSHFAPGERVLVTGSNIGESLDGGFAQFARVPAQAVVPLPPALSLFDAMVLGTAGFTAAMAVWRMQQNHQVADHGAIAVTGPTGGVGSIALAILKQAGFATAAITGKADAADYLQRMGADEVVNRHALDLGSKPLESARWGGAVDNLGGRTLAYLMRTVRPWGNIACIGLAESASFEATVMPLILRGVSLLGIHSGEVPRNWRLTLWQKLAAEWRLESLGDRLVRDVIDLERIPEMCAELIAGRALGRYVVRIGGDL